MQYEKIIKAIEESNLTLGELLQIKYVLERKIESIRLGGGGSMTCDIKKEDIKKEDCPYYENG